MPPKEQIQNYPLSYKDWVANCPNPEEARETIHACISDIMSPKFNKPDYSDLETSFNAQEDELKISPALRVWNENSIGIFDDHDSDLHSALGDVYLRHINEIVNQFGFQFRCQNDLKQFVLDLGFHNGRHSYSSGGTDVLIYERSVTAKQK